MRFCDPGCLESGLGTSGIRIPAMLGLHEGMVLRTAVRSQAIAGERSSETSGPAKWNRAEE